MNDLILNFVRSSGYPVTFSDLSAGVPGFVGDRVLALQENVILWHAVSEEGIKALNFLRESELIELAPADVRLYENQIVPGLPNASHDHLGNGGLYDTPHWAPAVECRCGRQVSSFLLRALGGLCGSQGNIWRSCIVPYLQPGRRPAVGAACMMQLATPSLKAACRSPRSMYN